ncbi:MAG: spore maturation protein [Oscillospiraceae bacterium]|nr:spore maturation protein [Oscillospiraceae bacterium]
MTDLFVPLLLLGVSVYALHKKEDVYSTLLLGAQDGLHLLVSILPALTVLLCAVSMLRESGFIDLFSKWLSPVCRFIGIPAELVPLMLIRPISGSAALAVGADILAAHGADSLVGRMCAVMLGSTETTFYTVSVYFGAAGIRKTRHTIPAALIADLVGFLTASWTARLFFSDI